MRIYIFLIGLFCLFLCASCHRLAPLEPQVVPPEIPEVIFPANDTTDIQINVKFVWSAGNSGNKDSIVYDFYLKAEQPEPELLASGITDTTFQYNSLEYNTQYHWKVVAKDQNGETRTSPVWIFSTRYEHNNPPNVPNNPQPENGITSFPIGSSVASWSGGDPDSFSVVMYDIYLGTKSNSLNLISENQPDTFLIMNNLEFNSQYYWKIIAKDHYGLVSEGPVWNFSTEYAGLIFDENFDSYLTHAYPDTKIWTINKDSADLFITDSISWNNNGKSVCFIDSTEEGSCFLGTRLPARSVGVLKFCWRIKSKDDVFGLRMYSQQSENERLGPQLSIRQGQLQYYDSNYTWQQACEIDSNTWYQIKLFFNCQQGFYRIFVNEELVVEKATWTGSAVPNLDIIYFLTFDNRVCKEAYLDEIEFYAGSGL